MKNIRKKIKLILKRFGIKDNTLKSIDKITKINFYSKKINKNKELIKNYFLMKFGKRKYIEYVLRKKILKNNEQFGDNNFYQSYPPLNFRGDRDTLKRYKNYNIKKYLDKNKEILDIGGNLCFFSLYTSRFVKNIDIVEYNKNLAEIGNELKKHEGIENVKIFNEDFKLFDNKKKYDIIFSFAIHHWVGLDFKTYLEKIYYFLKEDGILFIESQNLKIDPFEERLDSIKKMYKLISLNDSNDHKGIERKIAVLKKI